MGGMRAVAQKAGCPRNCGTRTGDCHACSAGTPPAAQEINKVLSRFKKTRSRHTARRAHKGEKIALRRGILWQPVSREEERTALRNDTVIVEGVAEHARCFERYLDP